MLATCTLEFLQQWSQPEPCTGSVAVFQCLDPVTYEAHTWSLCDGHQQQYLRCLRCRTRFVSPYMLRRLCLHCAELLRETGEPEYVR